MKAPIWALSQQRGLRTSGHMLFHYHDRRDRMINQPCAPARILHHRRGLGAPWRQDEEPRRRVADVYHQLGR